MLETRFYWKLYAGYVLLILFTATLVAVFSSSVLENAVLEEIKQRLESTVRQTASHAIVSEGFRPGHELQRELNQLVSPDDARITIINEVGVVLGDNWEDPAVMENHAERPEVIKARNTGSGYSRRFSETIDDDLMYYAQRIDHNDVTIGYIRAAMRLDSIARYFQTLRMSVIVATIFTALIALLLGLAVSRQVTAPLSEMSAEIEHLAQGDAIGHIKTEARDEIGSLARSFNRMAGTIQQQLKEMDQDRMQLQAILSGMVEGVLAVDQDERILHMNRAAGKMLNLSPNSCIGMRTWEMVRIPQLVDTVKSVLDQGEEEENELKLVIGGTVRRLAISVSALHNAERELTGAVVVTHDMTKLRQLEEIRRDFVANVSHELKTPLTAIRGLVETMIEDPSMDEVTQARFLIRVQHQSDRLSKLVNDLLSLSRIESQGEELERKLIDLRQPAQEVYKRMLPHAESKKIRLVCAMPAEPVQTWADHESIIEAIGNLLDNAIKYTPEDGDVELAISNDGKSILISVSDTGIGIPTEHHDRIFERFYRVDKARSRELGGTGLGLAIVKHIARAHNGKVSLRSLPGKGTTIIITLPLDNQA